MQTILDAATAELDPVTLYRILELRTVVFVVEQECAYPELDGRDLEPGTRHVWVADGDDVIAVARVLTEADRYRIGRVATRADHRGGGLAATVMKRALELCTGPIVLDAQSYLVDWYAQFGFEPSGAEFVEDGIPHVPMIRTS